MYRICRFEGPGPGVWSKKHGDRRGEMLNWEGEDLESRLDEIVLNISET
jgi:hypothetical protein